MGKLGKTRYHRDRIKIDLARLIFRTKKPPYTANFIQIVQTIFEISKYI